ncbi:MAG TPA: hypothetical protein PKW95_23465 [bacterium]|nr:hypothetical protein [bacterium]
MRLLKFALPMLLLACLAFVVTCDEGSFNAETASAPLEDSSSPALPQSADGNGLSAVNAAADFETRFNANGLIVSDRYDEWTLTWTTVSIGREGAWATLDAVTPVAVACDKQTIGECSSMTTYRHATFSEWYANRPNVLEQGWTFDARPAGNGPLTIEGKIGGNLLATMDEEGERVIFSLNEREVLIYSGLHVTDANGNEIPASMELEGETIRLLIDDARAVYPLTVDPGLSPAPAWSLSLNPDKISSGDINGDGYIDAVVISGGQLRAYYGSANGLSSFANWTSTLSVYSRLDATGDFNGDGYDDVAAGNFGSNAVDVFYGSASGPPSDSDWVVIKDSKFGYSIASAGDVNGDGYDELLISAPYAWSSLAEVGAAFVYYGSATGLPTTESWSHFGAEGYDYFGRIVSAAGDVNGDGYGDIMVVDNYGVIFLFNGSADGLTTSPTWTNNCGGYFTGLASAGDVNGDGYGDFMVGNYRSLTAQVFFGSATGPASSWSYTLDQASSMFGNSVSSAGDVNADGYDDVMVGAYRYSNPETNEGGVFLFYGSADGLPATPSIVLENNVASSMFGYCVSSAGDTDLDGYDDILVAAYHGDMYLFLGGCKTGCVYNDECYTDGDAMPDNECLVCDGTSWTPDDGATCDDGLYCNGADSCLTGYCSQHEGDPCADNGVYCDGEETCDEESDSCVSSGDPCPDDGQFCNGDESCNEAEATCDHTGDPCDDPLICDEGGDECVTTCTGCYIDGICYYDGQPAIPGEPCLVCNTEISTEEFVYNDGAACDDGVYCNGADVCMDGYCSQHDGDPCSAGDDQFCNGEETCNEAEATCDHSGNPCSAPFICDEGGDECATTCTGCYIDGVCYYNNQPNPDNACLACLTMYSTSAWSNNDGASCDDGIFCNGDDRCTAGSCDDHAGDPCDEWETCNEAAGECELTGDDDDDDDDDGCGSGGANWVSRALKTVNR